MNEQIFREKSIDRVSSPEQIDDYVKISNPGVWILVFAVAFLIFGAVIWGIFGKTEKTFSGVAVSENENVLIYVKESDADKIEPGCEIRVNDEKLVVREKYGDPVKADESLGEYFIYLGEFKSGEWLYTMSAEGVLPNGIYKAVIVAESESPIASLFE